jgi:hypothetical protein
MELKNMKQKETKRVEAYYEWIQKLVHGLQVRTINKFLTIVFRAHLQSYFRTMTTGMKWSTLHQHEATMLCEKNMIIAKSRSSLSIPQSTKQVALMKTQSYIRNTNKYYTNDGMTNHNVETCKKKKEHNQVKNHRKHLHMHATSMV